MKKNIGFIFASVLIAVLLGLLTINGTKTAFGIIGLIFLFLLSGAVIFKTGLKKIDKYILYFIVASIPFPYLLQFLGKDALTITTVMIYFLFMVMILRYFLERKGPGIKPGFIFIMPVLIFMSLTASFALNPYFMGQSVKYYIANLSGILLYFIALSVIKNKADLAMVIKIILFTLILESGIVFLVYKFPSMERYLEIFNPRISMADFSVSEGIERSVGTIWDYELLAEWFLVGSILSIGLFYNFKKNRYIFSLFCCLTGMIFTVTRSALFLFIFGLALIFILLGMFKKDSIMGTVKIILSLFLGCAVLFWIFPEQIDKLTERLSAYFHHSNLLSPEAINRKLVWKEAFRNFLREPTIFGKGIYNVEMLYYSAGSFHSLYLTILYKLGIFGLFVYFVFWLKILYESCRILTVKKKSDNWYIMFFLFISVILILIDGIKIEYLRYGHTIQFAWLIYGLLAVSIKQNRENNENTMVPKTSV